MHGQRGGRGGGAGRGGRCCREPEEDLGAAWGRERGCQAAPLLAPASGLRSGKPFRIQGHGRRQPRSTRRPWPPAGACGARRGRGDAALAHGQEREGAGAALSRGPRQLRACQVLQQRQGSCSAVPTLSCSAPPAPPRLPAGCGSRWTMPKLLFRRTWQGLLSRVCAGTLLPLHCRGTVLVLLGERGVPALGWVWADVPARCAVKCSHM